MENFLFFLKFAIILVSDLANALGQADFLLRHFGQRGCGVVEALSDPIYFLLISFVLSRKGIFLLFEMVILIVEDIDFFLHDVFIEIHFLGHFLEHSF